MKKYFCVIIVVWLDWIRTPGPEMGILWEFKYWLRIYLDRGQMTAQSGSVKSLVYFSLSKHMGDGKVKLGRSPYAFQLLFLACFRLARGWSQSDEKKNRIAFLPLMALGNESPKEFWFWVLEDLPKDFGCWSIIYVIFNVVLQKFWKTINKKVLFT